MNAIWFTFIVAVQFACVVCSADDQNVSNIRTTEVNNRGEDTSIENFPYQVILNITFNPTKDMKLYHTCEGGIINPKVIITAAFCVGDEHVIEIKVRAGSKFSYKGGVEKKVEQVILHESFGIRRGPLKGEPRKLVDVALLKLSEDLQYTKSIKNIPFAKQGDNLAVGDMGIVAGWGYTKDNRLATVLQKTKLQVLSKETCTVTLTDLTDRVFCADLYSWDTGSTCRGNSGGPFVKNNQIYGIISLGFRKCKGSSSEPLIVTNTSSLHNWIAANVEALSSHGFRCDGFSSDSRCRIL